jgi:hypothetical protein
LGDISKPLYQIALTFFPETESDIRRLLDKIGGQKMELAMETFEAQLLAIVKRLESSVQNGFLSTQVITDEVNIGRDEKFKYSTTSIGKKLVSIGFDRARTSGQKGILYNRTLVHKLLIAYGLNPDDSSAPYDPGSGVPNLLAQEAQRKHEFSNLDQYTDDEYIENYLKKNPLKED